jgi:hypothetical protein
MNHPRLDREIEALLEQVSADLLDRGARATLLVGSHAKGTARPDSDVDIFAVGEGPHESFFIVDGHRVSVHWWQPEQARERIFQPQSAFLAVSAWRDAVVIDDPHGLGVELQTQAREWRWEAIEAEADAWVVDKLVGWAEYVMKLAAAVEAGRELDARALAAEITLRVAEVCAVQSRLLAESENGLWEQIAIAGGPEWRRAQEQAFAAHGESAAEAATGAIRLFELAVGEADELFDEEQRELVEHALATSRSRSE